MKAKNRIVTPVLFFFGPHSDEAYQFKALDGFYKQWVCRSPLESLFKVTGLKKFKLLISTARSKGSVKVIFTRHFGRTMTLCELPSGDIRMLFSTLSDFIFPRISRRKVNSIRYVKLIRVK